ncbi:MAG TPA: hypothetical protein VLF62_01375 [Candidatus Saccharimonadales bacterium]|nr:hypothetical protein [Candidatus Saccharimonadales bacterium]
MAEALTFAANPPFAASAVLDGALRLAIAGPEAAQLVITAAPPEVAASAAAELEAVAAAHKPAHPELASLHAMGREMEQQARFDPSAKSRLPLVTPGEAYQLGVYVAASAVETHLAGRQQVRTDLVNQRIRSMAQALLISQSGYEPGSRKKVLAAALDFSLDAAMRSSQAGILVKAMVEDARSAEPPALAAQALSYWASEPTAHMERVVDGTRRRLEPPAIKVQGMTSMQLKKAAPGFVAAVMDNTELPADAPEASPLTLYQGGIRQAIAYISLVTAKTASGEWNTSISA